MRVWAYPEEGKINWVPLSEEHRQNFMPLAGEIGKAWALPLAGCVTLGQLLKKPPEPQLFCFFFL